MNALGCALLRDGGWKAVVRRVCERYAISQEEMMGRDRHAQVVLARQEAMEFLYRQGLSMSVIGRLMRRDHSTVQYGVRRHRRRMEEEALRES